MTHTRLSLRFLGGTGTVTGSKFLLHTPRTTVLLDCGLFQGPKELRLRNRAELPFDPRDLDAVVITHAHVDHLGFLPALTSRGLRAPVHVTDGTAALARVVLPDAGRLQEEEAEWANRVGSSRHHPARPLFTEDDAVAALDRLEPHGFGSPVQVADDVAVTFFRAGHILGSSWLLVDVDGCGTLALSGDLGRAHHPLLLPPDPLPAVDTVLVESTYGNRLHHDADAVDVLADAIVRTARRGGTVVIPSFAVDRTEVLLIHLRRLMNEGTIPELPVYVDSPMALDGLRAYRRAIDEGWPELRQRQHDGGSDDPFDTGRLIEARSVDESKAASRLRFPAVVIAASGMATGGRVLHHLAVRLPDARNTVVLPGFQAEGTRGRALAEGARQVKIFGEYVDVRAEVVPIDGFSVHADRTELLGWLRTAPQPPRTCFVVHGEAEASAELRDAIDDVLGWRAVVPRHDELVLLGRRPDTAPGPEPTAAPSAGDASQSEKG